MASGFSAQRGGSGAEPPTTMTLSYEAARAALDGERLPAAVVDLDAFDANLARTVAGLDGRGTPLRVDGTASVRMRDIGLLLALFTRHKDYPKWVLRLLDAGQATVTARAQVKDATIVLDDVTASNDRFDLQARLRLAQRRAHGDLYLRWARLGLGLELREGERKFHLLRAREWFDEQPRLLPAPR